MEKETKIIKTHEELKAIIDAYNSQQTDIDRLNHLQDNPYFYLLLDYDDSTTCVLFNDNALDKLIFKDDYIDDNFEINEFDNNIATPNGLSQLLNQMSIIHDFA